MAIHDPQISQRIVLILGSAPNAVDCRAWPKLPFTDIVAINNAWAVRPDWDYLIHPEDFAEHRLPSALRDGQKVITHKEFVPIQNSLGGVVYAGGTMAFTAGYWALGALAPAVMAFFGCDMVYPSNGQTHFYGQGTADPLRHDVTLSSLEAKSARLHLIAAQQGCHAVNLSVGPTRLTLPRAHINDLAALAYGSAPEAPEDVVRARDAEDQLGYFVPSGRYWENEQAFDPEEVRRIDALWLEAQRQAVPAEA